MINKTNKLILVWQKNLGFFYDGWYFDNNNDLNNALK